MNILKIILEVVLRIKPVHREEELQATEDERKSNVEKNADAFTLMYHDIKTSVINEPSKVESTMTRDQIAALNQLATEIQRAVEQGTSIRHSDVRSLARLSLMAANVLEHLAEKGSEP